MIFVLQENLLTGTYLTCGLVQQCSVLILSPDNRNFIGGQFMHAKLVRYDSKKRITYIRLKLRMQLSIQFDKLNMKVIFLNSAISHSFNHFIQKHICKFHAYTYFCIDTFQSNTYMQHMLNTLCFVILSRGLIIFRVQSLEDY